MGDMGRGKPTGPRRVGDETRQRIEDLADGWDLDKAIPPPRVPVEPDTEPVPRVGPPPPPPPVRSKTPSVPPPLPPSRTKSPSAPPPPALPRTEATQSDGDATLLHLDEAEPARPTPGLRPRKLEALPRQRGVLGDVRYVFAALFGVARARRELVETERELEGERRARDERLIAVARHALGDPAATGAAVVAAREALADGEENRSRHAGAAAAAEQEIATLERARADAHQAFLAEDQRLDTEIRAIEAKLAPLEKSAADTRRQIAGLQATAEALDRKIQAEERKLVSVSKRGHPAEVEAGLAALRAEREAVLADEPKLAAELAAVEPRIAGLAGARAEAAKQRAAARESEERDAARTGERIDAARALLKVETNSVADADRARDQALLALGERLDVDRPAGYADKLRGADEHAVSMATLERRQLELQELVQGVERAALVRGVVWLVLAAGIAAAIAVLVLMAR